MLMVVNGDTRDDGAFSPPPKGKMRNMERRLEHQELDFEDRMTQLQLEHEEKVATMMPDDLRGQLEDTIASLKTQVRNTFS